MNKKTGIGTLALALGLLPTLLTARYNDVSLLELAMEALRLSYAPWMAALGLLLSVPGLLLGLTHRGDRGAGAGALLCGVNAVSLLIRLAASL